MSGQRLTVALVAQVPFHRWVLEPLCTALEARGHAVTVLGHQPAHRHDWLQLQAEDSPVAVALRALHPDLVVAADHPYAHLRRWAGGAPVLAVRHSLASRGNTWSDELQGADYLATWSAWDEALLDRRRVLGPVRLRSGPPWFPSPGRLDREREGRAWRRLYAGDGDRRVVAWCGSWNQAFWMAPTVVPALRGLHEEGSAVVARLHPHAALDSSPGAAELRALGLWAFAAQADPFAPPWPVLAGADAVVCDVSGFALLAAVLPWGPPVVQVDPPNAVLAGHAQDDPEGPEWVFREVVGPRCPAGLGLAGVVRSALAAREGQDRRASLALAEELLGLEGAGAWASFDPAGRLVEQVEEAVGARRS